MIAYIICGVAAVFLLTVLFGPPYVPSRLNEVEAVFKKIGLSSTDVVVDIGSGDGKVLRFVSSKIAKGVGLEINPILAGWSKIVSIKYPNLEFWLDNAMTAKFPADATVFYLFATTRFARQIASRLQAFSNQQQREVKVVSYGFELPFAVTGKKFRAYHIYYLKPFTTVGKVDTIT